jgi:hypothetical protein
LTSRQGGQAQGVTAAPDLGPSCPEELAAAAHRAVAQAWASVAPESSSTPRTRLRYADDAGSVCATTQLVDVRPDGFALLLTLRHELRQAGWVVGRPPADPRQTVAWGPEGQLYATFSPTTTSVLLELTTEAVRVGVDRARELVDGDRVFA